MGDNRYELILKRFETNADEIDEEGQDNPLKLTPGQKADFKAAFRVVAGEGVQSVPEEKVNDVLMAAGYTFQDEHIDEMMEHCVDDHSGEYGADNLLDAFESWMSDQITKDELSTVFNMMADENKLSVPFPAEDTPKAFSMETTKVISMKALQKSLDDLYGLSGTGNDTFNMESVKEISNEIATNPPEEGISFKDFIKLFKGY